MSNEDNRFSARAARYVKIGAGVGSIAAKAAGQRLHRVVRDDAGTVIGQAAAVPRWVYLS